MPKIYLCISRCADLFLGDEMNSDIKIKSKTIIKNDTVRLFFASALSFVLRRGTFALWLYVIVAVIKNGILDFYLENYNDVLVYGIAVFDMFFVTFILFLFICALRLGEQFLYFIKASGGSGRFLLLFHFFTFEKSFRALSLFVQLTVRKTLWLLYYLFPCVVCYGITFYLYLYGNISTVVFYILTAGSSVLLALCVFMCRVTFFRFNAASYYVGLNPYITPIEAIKKSIRFTDGFLRESALLESSFFGWFLSCLSLISVVYVVPYFKISKALFVVENSGMKVYPERKTQYAINYLKLK